MGVELKMIRSVETKVVKDLKQRFGVVKEIFPNNPVCYELLKNRTYIAGGAIRSVVLEEKVNDIDIFFYDNISLKHFEEILFDNLGNLMVDLGNGWTFRETMNSYNFTYETSKYPKIQFIKMSTGMPGKMIDTFDFTFNMSFYVPSSEYLYIGDIEAIKEKKICVNQSNCSVVNTFFRLHKFMAKGWRLDENALVDITILLSSLPQLKSRKEVKERLLLAPSTIEFNNLVAEEV